MGHYEDKVYHILEEVNRLGVNKEFDILTDKLRDDHPHIDTRDLFEMALDEIKGHSKDNTDE